MSQASYRWVLFATEGLDQIWLEQALRSCREDADLAGVGASDGRLLVDRAAWSTLVRRGLVSRLVGTAAETAELSAALQSGGWRVDDAVSPHLESALARPGMNEAVAHSLGESSVWMDGYCLLESWPFRNLKERLFLHWFVHAALLLWAGDGGSPLLRAVRQGRLRALRTVHFGHSHWIRYVRHRSWKEARALTKELSNDPG